MSVQSLISNYKNICEQMKRCSGELAELRERRAALEPEIRQVLERMDAPGVSIEGVEIFLEKRTRRARVGQKRKHAEILRILQAHHVSNPESVFEELSSIGSVEEKNVLKIKSK
jgi:hypothetical protein